MVSAARQPFILKLVTFYMIDGRSSPKYSFNIGVLICCATRSKYFNRHIHVRFIMDATMHRFDMKARHEKVTEKSLAFSVSPVTQILQSQCCCLS